MVQDRKQSSASATGSDSGVRQNSKERSGPRLQPIRVDQLDAEARAVLRGYLKGAADRFLSEGPDAARMPNVLATLMHHPKLAGPWLTYNSVLLNTPSIDPRLRELMILRVAWRARSRYEWLQHVRVGKQVGVTAEQIDAIAGDASAATWTPLEADLIAATDQLIDHYRIDDATWARLAETLDQRQLMEIVFVVGSYTCLAMAFNSFGIELDPELHDIDAPRMPEAKNR
jgi:alkylhydroperoxidase family enzyme